MQSCRRLLSLPPCRPAGRRQRQRQSTHPSASSQNSRTNDFSICKLCGHGPLHLRHVHDPCRSIAAHCEELACFQVLTAQPIGWSFLILGRNENLFRYESHNHSVAASSPCVRGHRSRIHVEDRSWKSRVGNQNFGAKPKLSDCIRCWQIKTGHSPIEPLDKAISLHPRFFSITNILATA